jgi:hypothetical protein
MHTLLLSMALDLTLREVIADIPRDAGTAVTLLVLVLFAGFVWHGSRTRPTSAATPGPRVERPDAAADRHLPEG